jgi:DNA-3-methyladenine glycosylase II
MKAIKGIGDWTADVYLMMALQRTDCFPAGDIALVKSIKAVKGLPANCSKEEILAKADEWRPCRTIAAYLLWHGYLSERKNKAR